MQPLKVWSWPAVLVTRVYDGDTFFCDIDQGRNTAWLSASVRLIGYNADEMRPSPSSPNAVAARNLLASLLAVSNATDPIVFGVVSVESVRYDAYQGRVDAWVFRDGNCVNIAMIQSGLVTPVPTWKTELAALLKHKAEPWNRVSRLL